MSKQEANNKMTSEMSLTNLYKKKILHCRNELSPALEMQS